MREASNAAPTPLGRDVGFPQNYLLKGASDSMSLEQAARNLHIELHQIYIKARRLGLPATFRHEEGSESTESTVSIVTVAPKKENLPSYTGQAVPGFTPPPTSTTS